MVNDDPDARSRESVAEENEIRNPMTEARKQIETRTQSNGYRVSSRTGQFRHSCFGILSSFVIRHSSLPLLLLTYAQAAPQITTFNKSGQLAWTNAPVPGVSTVEVATALSNNWSPTQNSYSVTSTGSVIVPVDSTNKFFRLRTVDVPPTAQGFTNLIQAYGILETLCGDGVGRQDNVSYWQPQFEGGVAAYASLSRPHYAMADKAGNIFIADKNSHAVLRISTNGTVHTHAGTHSGGYNGAGPMTATNMQLNLPNALWVRSDGVVYVLDTENARVRRVSTNGTAVTLFDAKSPPTSGVGGGRMLWVKDDESLAYFGDGDRIKKWTPSGGLQTLRSGFSQLGTFCVEASGSLIVADRIANRVWRIQSDGTGVIIAGNGTTTGGGDGSPALSTGLHGPRGVWPVPTGGYLLLLHDGAQLWYVDSANIMHLLVNGLGGNGYVHSGDGQYFYDPSQYKIGEGRSVSMDYAGNIIICESDYGFIRRIRFERMLGN